MNDKHHWHFELGTENYLKAASFYIRYEVFVLERKIKKEDEFDQNDHDTTMYAVCFDDQKPVSTARLLVEDRQTVRITRVATLENYRGNGLNRRLIQQLEDYSKKSGYSKVIIHAEMTAVTYYEELGYVPYTDIYIEDERECISLKKML